MSITHSVISFVLAITLLVLTPGLDTALVLRTVTTEGARQAFRASAGVVSGCALWGLAAAIGLSAMLAASRVAFDVVKWTGALYLLWTGMTLLIKPRAALNDEEAPRPQHSVGAFTRGAMQNLLNPKIGVFYITFLPQFIPHGVSAGLYTLMLAGLHVMICMAWFTVLILATHAIAPIMRRRSVVRFMDRLTGVIFLGFGAKLAFSRV